MIVGFGKQIWLTFKREPALITGLVAAAIALACAFWGNVTSDTQATINTCTAAVAGLIVALVTQDGLSAAALGAAQAMLAAAVGFGLKLTVDQQAVIMGFITALVAAFVRTQVSAPQTQGSKPNTFHLEEARWQAEAPKKDTAPGAPSGV